MKNVKKFRLPTKSSCPGKSIYRWQYFDKKGKICEDEMNFQELINSARDETDFKKRLVIGNDGKPMVDTAGADAGVYADVSDIRTSEDLISAYEKIIAKSGKQELSAEELKKGLENLEEVEKKLDETKKEEEKK